MPKRVLVIGDSMSLAHVARAIVVARRLIREGAKVVFATGPAHQALARQEGFEPRKVYCVPPEYAHAAIRRGSHIFDLSTLKQYVDSDLALIRSERPDLIIGDMRMSLNISADLAGVEHWSIISGYLTRYYDAPQSPPKTFPLFRVLGSQFSRLLYPVVKSAMLRHYAASFRCFRRKLGLPDVENIFDVIASPHRNLIADLPRFVPCTALPSHFEYVGPLLWEPSVPDPPWLAQLDPDVPTAYVSMGSTGDAHDSIRILVTLRDAGWQVLTTTGSHINSVAGILACKYGRGSTLLQRSRVVVCHGGSGTLYQAIAHGVPAIGVPTFHDQETNLERAEALRWGVALDPIRWRESDLLGAIERVCAPEYRRAIAESRHEILRFVRETEERPLLCWQTIRRDSNRFRQESHTSL
jgi:UDP:flavonoid glycosyltransferase YjiC (YdhE family)